MLEAAFRDTYGLSLDDVFTALDFAIGTYRRTVSGVIPKMTQVAWETKKDEIEKNNPGITREKFLYNLSKADYEKAWGSKYSEPGFGSKLLAFIIRIIPKIGPFSALSFRTPTPETEMLFMGSFNATVERYGALLAAERSRGTPPADVNLDLGKPTVAGMYKISDDTYAKLLDELAKRHLAGIPAALREDILAFYRDEKAPISPKLRSELEELKN